MNEKIRELKEQAGITTNLDTDYYDKRDANNWMDYFSEKFAELIIRECCDVFVELRTRPADLAVKDVKKHFGVEE